MRRYHDTSLPFKCDRCTYRFATEARLKSHELTGHLRKSTQVNEEIKSESPSNDDRMVTAVVCEFCNQTFSQNHNLQRHYQRIHLNELKHACEHCDKKFIDAQYLYRHVVKFHEKGDSDMTVSSVPKATPGEPFDDICKFCKQTFNGSKYRYERHLISMHEAQLESVFQCDICSKKFMYFNSMKIHMESHRKRIREEDYPIKCTHCIRRFLDEDKMKKHV